MTDLLAAIDAWDKAAVAWVQASLHAPLLTAAMEIVTNKFYWFAPLTAIWIYLAIKGGRGRVAAVLLIPLIILSDAGTSHVLKPLFGRPRPLGNAGLSFPSTHATNAFAIATMLAWSVRNLPFRILAYALAALVAFSRVYLGVHYPGDVLAGAAVGTLDALILVGLYLILRPQLEGRFPKLFQPSEKTDLGT